MIRIIYPKPGEVSRMGGLQLLEVEADTEAEIMALTSRIDDGVQVFIAAPGSIAHTPDHSADWEFGPAGTWVKRGGRGGGTAPVVILPETTAEGEDGPMFITTPLARRPEENVTYTVTYNGTPYDCVGTFMEQEGVLGLPLGNMGLMGAPGGNPNAPFLVVLFLDGDESWGDGTPVYALVMDATGATSATVSVVEAGGNAGGSSGGFIVNATLTDMDTGTTSGPCVFDKTFAETLAAVKEGRYVSCHLATPLMGGGTFVLPVVTYADDEIEFAAYVAGVTLLVTMSNTGDGEFSMIM